MIKVNTNRMLLIAGAFLWVLMLGIGIRALLTYENTPGDIAAAPAEWPVSSRIELASDRPTLIMLAHPRCPCTRASIHELDRLMTQVGDRVKAYVIFIRPQIFTEEWEKTDLWTKAAAIRGVSVVSDDAGIEAKRFQTVTSGQAILYDKDGKLIFNGGITSARGHEGDNEGGIAIISLINSGGAKRNETAVFGCPLFEQSVEGREKEVVDERYKN